MIIRASGHLALILAAGLLLLGAPVKAADGDDSTTGAQSDNSTAAPVAHRASRQLSHHRRHYTHRKSHAVAKDDSDKADKKVAAADPGANNSESKIEPQLPPTIANANAQMLFASAQINAAAAIPSGANIPATASGNPANANADNGTMMVAADQLNDVDRTLQEGSPTTATTASPTPTPATAAASSPPIPAPIATGESSVWDQTSLIGKIFIGFGALLTMASAARMLIG